MKKFTIAMMATSIMLAGGALDSVSKGSSVYAAEATMTDAMKRAIYQRAFNGEQMSEPTAAKQALYNEYTVQIKNSIKDKVYKGAVLGNTIPWQVKHYETEKAGLVKRIYDLAFNGKTISEPNAVKTDLYNKALTQIKKGLYNKVHRGEAAGTSIKWQVKYHASEKGKMEREISRHAYNGTKLSEPTPHKEKLLKVEQDKIKAKLDNQAYRTDAQTYLSKNTVKWQKDYLRAAIENVAAMKKAQTVKITFIGDQVSAQAATMTKAKFKLFSNLSKADRKMSQVPALVQTLKRVNTLGSLVVIHVGANEHFTAATLESIVSAVGKDKQILFITNEMNRSWETSSNEALKNVSTKYAHVRYADWNATSKGKNYFATDKTNLNVAGQQAFAKFLEGTILTMVKNQQS